MTQIIDTYLIALGFDADDLAKSRTRGWLYAGIGINLALAILFTSLAVAA